MRETSSLRTRIKICGITSPDAARAAEAAGCDAIGVVLWPRSKRYVDIATAAGIAQAVSPLVSVVGVFVDSPIEAIARARYTIGLDAVQLHGAMPDGDWKRLMSVVSLIRGLSIGSKGLEAERHFGFSDYLLDSADANAHGGTGATFDWALAAPFCDWGRIWLAGGLNPENVGTAITTVRPFAVDVSTGVESAPGQKSPDLMREFVNSVRRADTGRG
ncbi:MAG TPA: phosphoribosylanthranilate isomerase [candidate division Zixibacteria bacterium]|nr:phosphoribosylanthranilate isomerase [candidate division Zixibacteria bacterium]